MKAILLKGGTIVDGTGRPAFVGDVLVEGDRIVEIRPLGSDRVGVGSAGSDRVGVGSAGSDRVGVGSAESDRVGVGSAGADGVGVGSAGADATASLRTLETLKDSNLETIDATGLIVSPGFIDAHTHSDAYLVIEPDAPSKITQGITTELNGQCGGSVAPRYGEARLSSDWAAILGERLTWRSLAEYREVLAAARPAVNTVQFIGHNTLRSSVVGYSARELARGELEQMTRLLAESLDAGGWGLTTGLIYQPGKYSTPEEVVALAKVAAAKGGYYATHMRSEGDRILESIDEVIGLVKQTGIKAEISHLKTGGRENWPKIDAVLEKIEGAMAEGLLLGSDRYPYCAAGTDLDIVLPDWAQEGAAPAEMKRLEDGGLRARIIEEINAQDRDWSEVMIGGTWAEANKPFSGKTVGEIVESLNCRIVESGSGDSGEEGDQTRCVSSVIRRFNDSHDSTIRTVSPGELITSILLADGCKTGAFFFTMSEENLAKIYSRPWIVPGSDASLRAPWGPLGADHPHPRAYATMPEFYRRVRALGFSREETVARMTSAVADRFGIRGRGRVEKGAFADLVVWNEAEFKARATFTNPHQFTGGVKMVMTNGIVSYCDGKFTGARGGRFLER